jgi:hypothetical protein
MTRRDPVRQGQESSGNRSTRNRRGHISLYCVNAYPDSREPPDEDRQGAREPSAGGQAVVARWTLPADDGGGCVRNSGSNQHCDEFGSEVEARLCGLVLVAHH